MSGPPLRWGLVGASNWAGSWMVDAFREAGGAVVSVHSSSRERGARFAERHRLERSDDELAALVGADDIDAVYVSTTNERHLEGALAAAAAGKHVLCEKPLAITLEEARVMRRACADAGVVLAVNHYLRSLDTVKMIRRLLREGSVGEVLSARCFHPGTLPAKLRTWRTNKPETGAGVALDITVHDADTLRFVLDDEIASVSAIAATQGVAAGGIEDNVVGAMKTDGGVTIDFQSTFTLPEAKTVLEVHGSEGSLIGHDILEPTASGEVILRRAGEEAAVEPRQRRNPYVVNAEAMARAVAGDGQPIASGRDGFASLAIALAVLQSAETGRETVLDDEWRR